MARVDGYAPIRDYAVVGDGRTAALVARDGAVDWLCLPDFDSGAVFGALLDPARGGVFRISPREPFESERRYLGDTNVLETTFRTAAGTVRVTDAMCLIGEGLGPMRELVRKVEALEGRVPLEVDFEPRFRFGARPTRIRTTLGRVVAECKADAATLAAFGCEIEPEPAGAHGELTLEAGESALLALTFSSKEPLVFPGRADCERRLERTRQFWTAWSGRARYEGRWREAVIRSALVLKLLVYSPSGAIVAAPTTSLPEQVGGVRNWDYRFAWLRDASWTLDALLRLGYRDESRAFLWWFMHASRLTHPRLQVLYRINGSNRAPEQEIDLAGYRGSKPVRAGNAALDQVQLDLYGDVVQAIWLYVEDGAPLDRATAKDVAQLTDWVVENWQLPDSGIWEVQGPPEQFVQSKALLWVALDRACQLAERGAIPDGRERWQRAARQVREFVEERGFDVEIGAYVRRVGHRELDASILTLPLLDWSEPTDERVASTVEAVRRDLSAGGPLLFRYRADDGVPGHEGAFLACSFWLVDALARTQRLGEAVALMDELVAFGNDVGLYSEQADPRTGEFLGNFPQGLTHLALINAAVTIAEVEAAA